MGKMGPQWRDEHRTAERYTEKITGRGEQRLRSMGQAGEVGTERDMGERRLDGIEQKQREKQGQRVRGEQSEGR